MKVEINPVPVATISVGKPCTECEEEANSPENPLDPFNPQDQVNLSGTGENRLANSGRDVPENGEGEESEPAGAGEPQSLSGQPLTDEEQRLVEQLRSRDREVRAHEQAHKAAAGQYATSGPTYEYTTGPDGRRYAIGGEVGIDTSPVPNNPQATIRKAQTIRRAALAPAEPSGQDRQVAAQATQLETQARRELQEQRTEENRERTESQNTVGDGESEESSTENNAPSASTQTSASPVIERERQVIARFNTPDRETGSRLNLFS